MVGKDVLHYRIIEEVGRGGMGIVFRARDTRLDRDVALKFLPPHLSTSAQDKARFIQEAKAAATLDHPNICTVYSIEEYEGQLFIVMQFVDGQLLRERIIGLSEKQATDIGIQIAEGLAAAHDRGIVHRDIKPENIMVRKDGIVQIMDFGLAKLKGVTRLTKEGSTVGTAGYMSPEQVQGLEADHRSDIFSFGVLLYEMFTGETPFRGVHETAVAYEIVNVDAQPPSSARPGITPALDAIIMECLEKDPRERTQSASQIAVDLKRYKRESGRQRVSMNAPVQPLAGPGPGSATQTNVAPPFERKRRATQWGVTAAVGVVMLALGYGVAFLTTRDSTPPPLIRTMVDLPEVVRYWDALGGHSAISPDGTMIVFVGSDSASQQSLWVRPLHSHSARPLAGTHNASYPFWSPEGTSVGFFADGKLKTIDAGGGPAIALADAPFGRGGAWSTNGEILFSPSISDPNLYAIPAAGGPRRLVTAFDSTQAPRFPFFLPDGIHFVFSLLEGEQLTVPSLRVGSLEDPQTRLITDGAAHGMVTAGTMLYLRQGILMAQRFDESSIALVGRPVSIQDNINAWAPRAKGDFSVSRNGVILYAGGRTAREDEVIWIEEDGNETSIAQATVFNKPVLSPDGTRFAYDEIEQQQETHVWVYDLKKKTKTRITFDPHRAGSPCWSRDGKTLYFNLEDAGNKAVIGAKPADGSGTIEVIARGDQGLSAGYYPVSVTPDGRHLLLLIEDESKSELGFVDLRDGGRPAPITMLGIRGPGRTRDRNSVSLSPDGKWIAYESSELGSRSVFVTAFGGQSGRWQISPPGAMNPIWSKGGIVYYSMSSNRNERVDFSAAGGTPTFSPPKPVFPPGKAPNNMLYGSTADGRRHLALTRLNSGSGSSLFLVVNWQVLMTEEYSTPSR